MGGLGATRLGVGDRVADLLVGFPLRLRFEAVGQLAPRLHVRAQPVERIAALPLLGSAGSRYADGSSDVLCAPRR